MKEFKSTGDTAVAVFVLSMMLIALFTMMICAVSGGVTKEALLAILGLLAFSLILISLILHIVNYKIIYVPEEGALYETNLLGRRTKPFFLSEIKRVKVTQVDREDNLRESGNHEIWVSVKGKKRSLYFNSHTPGFDTLLEIVQAHSPQEGQKQRS